MSTNNPSSAATPATESKAKLTAAKEVLRKAREQVKSAKDAARKAKKIVKSLRKESDRLKKKNGSKTGKKISGYKVQPVRIVTVGSAA